MLTKYTDPIVTTYRYKPDGEKVTIPIEEKLEVTNGIVFLKEIPDKNLRVMIDGKIEVYKPEDLDSESKFYVDYNTGVIFVQKSLNGKKLSINYSGIGVTYYPASRIYLKVDENHNVTRTLADIEDQISNLNSLNNEQERLKREIEQRNQEISKTLEEVKKVDMTGAINEATQTKKALDDSIHNAKSTDATLKARIEFSEGVRVDLAKKNELAQKNIDSLEKANTSSESKTQTLNESIEKATKTNESLKATDSSITSSLSTYSTKSEELKASIEQVDSKKTALNDIIEKSNTADSSLKETTKLANESNENLKTTNQKATEINQSLKIENEKAEQTTTTLSSKIDSGLNVKIGLDDSIAKGKQIKTELDDSNAKATESNTTLKDSTEKAKKEKGDLTAIVTSGQEVAKELSERNQSANVNIEDLKRENKKAIDNTSGLQVETQNALTKQQTLSEETTKAQQAIQKITELLSSSTDLKTKLEQIIANGDLDKYVTDPKLKEILTAYATKDDLSKIDVTSQLSKYLERTEIPCYVDYKNPLDSISIKSGIMLVQCGMNHYDYNYKSFPDGRGIYLILTAVLRESSKLKQAHQLAFNIENHKLYRRWTFNLIEKKDGTFSGNFDKWEELKNNYAQKSDLELKANKSSIPTSLSQLTDDETHRLVTDEEKNKWNNSPNPDLTDYAKKTDLDDKIEKNSLDIMKNVDSSFNTVLKQIPTSLSQLTNDTNFKTETEIQEMISKSSSFKKEVVDALPSSGEENVFYLVKDTNGKDGNNYLEYLWINGKWELIGSTQVDLSGYASKIDLEKESIKLEESISNKAEKDDIPTKVSQLENDFDYLRTSNIKKTTLMSNERAGFFNFNTMGFKMGIEIISAMSRGKTPLQAKNFPDGIGQYAVLTTFDDKNGVIKNNTKSTQIVFCLKNRKIYQRSGHVIDTSDDKFQCEWSELKEIKSQSTTPDLSPFTQQELEEAFK